MVENESNAHWSQYWEQGHLTSFGESFSSNYTGVLNELWKPLFTTLDRDFKVLDIATGNGALPLLLNDYLKGKPLSGEVIGVDLAQIKTEIEASRLADNLSLSLVAGVDCCKLPYEDAQFNLAISQFGIEYADLKKAIPEALRVLKSNGRLGLVMHHHESLVLKLNRKILSLIGSDNVVKLFKLLTQIVERMGEVRNKEDLERVKHDSICEKLRNSLNVAIGELADEDEEALKDSELLTYVSTLFQVGLFWNVSKKTSYIDFAEQQIKTLQVRLSELVSAAQSESSLSALVAMLSVHGASLERLCSIKNENDEILGWNMLIIKQ